MKIKKGDLVNYHSLRGGPVTIPGCTVTHDPWLPDGWRKKDGMVTMVDKIRGFVSVAHLTKTTKGDEDE